MLEFWQICYIFTTVVICYEKKKLANCLQRWEEALWLARCRLGDDEYRDIATKYAEHLLTQGR